MNIIGKKVLLRAIEREDIKMLVDWHNDPELMAGVGGWAFPVSMAQQEKWFEESLGDKTTKRFCVVDKESGKLLGLTGLYEIEWKDRKALTAVIIGAKDVQGKGYAKDAIVAIEKFAFYYLGLNRLWGRIIEFNKASHRVYVDKCGWKIEGVLRSNIFRKGRFWNTSAVAILRSDFEEWLVKNPEFADEQA